MPKQHKMLPGQAELFDVKEVLKTAPCVLALRKAMGEWRDQGYPGVTESTRALLNFWFFTDYLSPFARRPFAYHDSQREAIETLIYVYEVAQVLTNKALLEQFARQGDLQLLTYDLFARYAIKMATGSGKTLVMALAVVWQYLNAVRESGAGQQTTCPGQRRARLC